jgi:hypothetical protein
MVASSIQTLPLILRKQKGPLLNPVCGSSDNLQKISSLLSVKNNVIPLTNRAEIPILIFDLSSLSTPLS